MASLDEQKDHSPILVGKYHDKTPNEIADMDPKYLVWAYETWKVKPCSKALYEALLEDEVESGEQDMFGADERFHGDL